MSTNTSTRPTTYGASIEHTDPVVVIIGSGAGGGTLAHELTAQGARCVVLEAGPYLTQDDFVNDEWEAFGQMAWLDMRTTSGGWRITRDFPNLPAWIVKAVGGSTTHWSGATPRFMAHEFRARSTYGDLAGANLLDWPVGLADLAPPTTGPSGRWARPTGTDDHPCRPTTTTRCSPGGPRRSGTGTTPPGLRHQRRAV